MPCSIDQYAHHIETNVSSQWIIGCSPVGKVTIRELIVNIYTIQRCLSEKMFCAVVARRCVNSYIFQLIIMKIEELICNVDPNAIH